MSTLAVWTVTHDIVSTPTLTTIAHNATMNICATSAAAAILQVIGLSGVLVPGTHYAVTGAHIDGTDWLNSDVPAAEIATSGVGTGTPVPVPVPVPASTP